MYGAIQMLVRYGRFGEILHEDCVFMDAVRGFHAPIRQKVSIFVRKNTQKYLQKLFRRSLNGIYWRYSEFSDRHYLCCGGCTGNGITIHRNRSRTASSNGKTVVPESGISSLRSSGGLSRRKRISHTFGSFRKGAKRTPKLIDRTKI